MKTTLFTISLAVFCAVSLEAQSIVNTLGSTGTFSIKDGSTTFLTLSQSTGYVSLTNSLTLPATTGSTIGVIYKGANRFIHDYQVPFTQGNNTFVGVNAGNFTMAASDLNEASYNTGVGADVLSSLTTGGYNSAFGYASLFNNTTGNRNSAFGYTSLNGNTTGVFNSAFGFQSLRNSTGGYNSAFGSQSLGSNSTGSFNSAFGMQAGFNITSGSNNTAIGYNALVPTANASNQVRIGDTNVTYYGVQVAWTVTSDRRWKSNIVQSGLGLDFVSRLNPVSYTRKNDKKQRTEYGFIAQELEEVLNEAGVKNAGMLTIDEKGGYELRYNDLLAPMVKAIQELKAENNTLRNEVVTLRASIAEQVKDEVKAVMLKAFRQEGAATEVSLNETKD